MQVARRDNPKAARALAEAAFSTDAKVCERYGITLRTLQNWRAALKADPELSRLFAEAHAELERRDWGDEVSRTLSAAAQKLQALILGAQSSDPETIRAVLEGVTGLAKIALTRELLQARMKGEGAPLSPRSQLVPPRQAQA